MMPDSHHPPALPDAGARQRALLDYGATLLVEAGAGSGKTALMAGRVALMLAHGIRPREIVAVTFTEAAAAELLERIERFVASLAAGTVPRELDQALDTGLSADQRAAITAAKAALEEITCTTIHGFCQQLIKPYPIEAGIDPGATIIDPAAADLAYQDLMTAWLSARFGRARGDDGFGRIPAMTGLGGEDDFFAELLAIAPDDAVTLIGDAANFLKIKRTAHAPHAELDTDILRRAFAGDTRLRRLVRRLWHCRTGDRRVYCRSHPIPDSSRRRSRRSHHRARYCPSIAACAARLLPQQRTTL